MLTLPPASRRMDPVQSQNLHRPNTHSRRSRAADLQAPRPENPGKSPPPYVLRTHHQKNAAFQCFNVLRSTCASS
jgi:hypothetical protein